ncbi:LicD family protein [Brachyspira intermedia]|uniref:LicD family protein n=1 Tax=Brachyspira intermedia TaxID=84377 RepID=UPI003006C327
MFKIVKTDKYTIIFILGIKITLKKKEKKSDIDSVVWWIPSKKLRNIIRNLHNNIDNINNHIYNIDNRINDINNHIYNMDNRMNDINNHIYNLTNIGNQINFKSDNLYDILSNSIDITKINKNTGILKDIQNISLLLLQHFDRIAKENNIKYWLQGGALLGAYRQNKFTNWDDDVDIGVMRTDLDKLFQIFKNDSVFSVDYFYHMIWEYPARMAKLTIKGELNFWIDIFSYDYINIEDDKEDELWNYFIDKRMKLGIELRELKLNYDFTPIYNYTDREKTDNIFNKYISEFSALKNGNHIIFGIDNIISSYKRLFKYNMIFPLKELMFEDKKYPVPNNYESYIYRQYGDPFKFPRYFHCHFDLSHNYDNLKLSIDNIYKKLKEAKLI